MVGEKPSPRAFSQDRQWQATPTHCVGLPLWCALFPPPSMFPAAAKIPRSPFLSAWFFVIVLPESATSIPSPPFRFDWFLASRFPVEPTKVWIPSTTFDRILFPVTKLFEVANSSIPLWFPNTLLWLIRMFDPWNG